MADLRALLTQVRARLVEASEEDYCGGTPSEAAAYQQCGKELVEWFDAEIAPALGAAKPLRGRREG